MYAFHRSCCYSSESLVHVLAPFCSFSQSKDISLLCMVVSAYPSSILLFLCISQALFVRVISAHPSSILLFLRNLHTLLLLFRVISADLSSILFILFNLQTLHLLFRVIIAHPSSIMLLLCNLLALFLLIRMIVEHPSSTLPFFFAFHRPCSYSLWSLLRIPAPFCYFYAIYRHCS